MLNAHRIVIDKSSMTLSQAVDGVKNKIINSAAAACSLGYYLMTIRDYNLYQDSDRYKKFVPEEYQTNSGILKFSKYTFYDYCRDEFGFSRRSVDRYMFICQEFCERSFLGDVTDKIDNKYKDYSISALAELLQLSEKKREQVTPDTSIKDIRAIKNNQPDDTDINECAVDKQPVTDLIDDNDVWATVDPADVDLADDYKLMQTKTYKKHKYILASDEFDKYVDNVAAYTAAYKDIADKLKRGYLVRLVMYKPED